MKKFLSIVIGLLLGLSVLFGTASPALAKVKVKGYYRKNSTYVQPYYRTNPDKKKWNNWSSQGNYNPYSGKKGYKKW